MRPDGAAGTTLDGKHDAVLAAMTEWLNDALFGAAKGEGDHIIWLGDHRWLFVNVEDPKNRLRHPDQPGADRARSMNRRDETTLAVLALGPPKRL